MSASGWLRPSLMSATSTRWCTLTWVAARPTPLAAYMVSNMSATNCFSFASNTVTGSARVRRRGSGNSRMDRTDMVFSPRRRKCGRLGENRALAPFRMCLIVRRQARVCRRFLSTDDCCASKGFSYTRPSIRGGGFPTMIRKSIVLLAGLLVTVAVYAAGAQLRADHPDNYTVRRGDTLWDISARFLVKPWLWPEIWQANPQVRNPHLIYPGDVLNLSFINGPTLRLQPSVHREGDAVSAIPLSELRTFLKDLRVMNSNEVSSAPYVVGLEENRLRGAVGQNLYVRGLQAAPGQRWAIVRPSHVFRGFEQDDPGDADSRIFAHELDSNAAMVNAPWREDSRHDGRIGRGQD